MDHHKQLKGHCFIMDDASINTSDSIRRFIESREYRCVYILSYSPEQFWSVVKSELKREKPLETETLNIRIIEAFLNSLFSNLEGFCHY